MDIYERTSIKELKQINNDLGNQIKSLQEQQNYVQSLINKHTLRLEGMSKKEFIIKCINDDLKNKEIEALLPDTLDSYIRQVRADYMGYGVKKALYKTANEKQGIEKIMRLVALDVYHNTSVFEVDAKGSKKPKYDIDVDFIAFIEHVYAHYRYGNQLFFNSVMERALALQGTNSQDLSTFLLKYFRLMDDKYERSPGRQLQVEKEKQIPELVHTVMMYKNISEHDYLAARPRIINQYRVKESYLDNIVYVIDTINTHKQKIYTPQQFMDVYTTIKNKTKLDAHVIKLILTNAGIIDAQYLNQII